MRNLPFAREVSYSFLHRDIDVTQAAKPVCAILLIDASKLMRSSGVLGQFVHLDHGSVMASVNWIRLQEDVMDDKAKLLTVARDEV